MGNATCSITSGSCCSNDIWLVCSQKEAALLSKHILIPPAMLPETEKATNSLCATNIGQYDGVTAEYHVSDIL